VVVGDNYIQLKPFCPLDLSQGGDATVNAYNQADTLLVELFQSSYLEPVALSEAVGYVGGDLTAEA